MKTWCVALSAVGLSVVGCGGGDSSSTTDAAVEDGGTARDMSRADAAPVIEDSFDNPIMVDDGSNESGVISPTEDTDTYAIDITSPRWLRVTIEANPDADPLRIDSVIELYDSTRTRIAQNDDAALSEGRDSDLISYIPAAGRYYIVVHDWGEWSPDGTARGSTLLDYEMYVQTITRSRTGFTVDAETGNDIASATELAFSGSAYGTLGGPMGADDDVDVYSFDIASNSQSFSLVLLKNGPDFNGSSAHPARVWITNADGSQVIAAQDDAAGAGTMMVPTPPGTWLLWVSAGADRGSNPFYLFKDRRGGENPSEAAGETNNTFETAEALAWSDNMAFVLATIGDGDVDYFAVPSVTAGNRIAAACMGQASGSGVRGLTMELISTDGTTVLTSATEMVTGEDLGASLTPTAAPTTGNYAIRITKTGQAEGVDGNWARCGLKISPPA